MTHEEFLNSPEGKAAIKAAVDDATEALAGKNRELLGEVKKLRKGGEIDPNDHQALQDQLEATQAKLKEADKTFAKLKTDAETFKKLAESEQGYSSKLLIENGLNDALTQAGVKPEFLKAAKAMIGAQVQLKQDGDNRLAVVGDKGLSDFVGEWSKSDEGKHFVSAPQNSGGGAQGGKGQGGSKQVSRQDFDAMNPIQRASHIKDGGTLVD
jgi:hypothetical protein